jgi:hypothetical protein
MLVEVETKVQKLFTKFTVRSQVFLEQKKPARAGSLAKQMLWVLRPKNFS